MPPVKVHPSEDVLTPDQVASWLQVRKRELDRMGVPCIVLSPRIRRYSRADVLQFIETRRRLRTG